MSDKIIFQAPGLISKITTLKDNTLKVNFDFNEMTPEAESALMSLRNSFSWVLIQAEKEFTENDIPVLPEIKRNDGEKTKAQRLRAVLYRYWEQCGKKDLFGNECDSETFYNQLMEQIIEFYKSKLT